MKKFRFAHISDLHFGSVSMSPLQFLSKRWVGNFNYLFSRKKVFAYERLLRLIPLFKEEQITHVIITGDLSVTSRRLEFSIGKRFIDLLKKEGICVFTLPGNHDHYTKRSYRKKRFYRFFDSKFDTKCPISLKEDKVTYTCLADGIWLVALDTALSTSLISSQGYFSPEGEKALEKALKAIPKDDTIILSNHFPFFQHEAPSKQLVRGPQLQELLTKHPNILLYLHGHTHRQTVADLRPNQLPIISDSGSTPHKTDGACHLFSLDQKAVHLDVFGWADQKWQISQTHEFLVQ